MDDSIIDEIPLLLRGDKVGVIEKVIVIPPPDVKNPWFKIAFSGTLIKEMKSVENLIKLLQKEGLHIGKP